ncbi:MAG TPA: hypothetical protein VNG51_14425, partial [Ktedonobacteraceae bacterium]|nr:hypothetical protein [Ktedonobacteraceae bacterium]
WSIDGEEIAVFYPKEVWSIDGEEIAVFYPEEVWSIDGEEIAVFYPEEVWSIDGEEIAVFYPEEATIYFFSSINDLVGGNATRVRHYNDTHARSYHCSGVPLWSPSRLACHHLLLAMTPCNNLTWKPENTVPLLFPMSRVIIPLRQSQPLASLIIPEHNISHFAHFLSQMSQMSQSSHIVLTTTLVTSHSTGCATRCREAHFYRYLFAIMRLVKGIDKTSDVVG